MKELVQNISTLLNNLNINWKLWIKEKEVRIYLKFWSQNKFSAESKQSYIDINRKWLVEGKFAGPGAQTREKRKEKLDKIEALLIELGFTRIDIQDAINNMKIENL